MIPTFIILFREVLEMALILSIILAATRGVAGRWRYISLGLLGGIVGSGLVALFADTISSAMEGMGQEVLNASILLLATAMLVWTVVWMSRHGRHLASKLKSVGQKVTEGELPMLAVASVVALSMWREGAEIVLFMYGILAATQESLVAIGLGALGGALLAGMMGTAMYLGLIRLSPKHMFNATGVLLALVAAGMSAHAAGYLAAAGVVPELSARVWDSSAFLSNDSVAGLVLHTLVGYNAQPSGIQIVTYVATLALIAVLVLLTREPRVVKPAIAAIVMATTFATPRHAHAAFELKSPHVEEGMFEVEVKNRWDHDHRASKDDKRVHEIGMGYGVNAWWFTELAGEIEKTQGESYGYIYQPDCRLSLA